MRLPQMTPRWWMIAKAIIALLLGISGRALASTVFLLAVQPSIPMLFGQATFQQGDASPSSHEGKHGLSANQFPIGRGDFDPSKRLSCYRGSSRGRMAL